MRFNRDTAADMRYQVGPSFLGHKGHVKDPHGLPEEPLIHGVSLAQYAGVEAGSATGLALDVVLANERIDPAAWPDAEEGWTEQILEEEDENEPLLQAYEERLAEAQERYGRRVPPLDTDLKAWLDFVRRWSADDDPNALLGRLELHASDVVRLHRTWAKLMAQDPALAERAKGILSQEPGDLPAIAPEPVTPKPFEPEYVWSTTVPLLVVFERNDENDEDDEDNEDDEDALDDFPPLFAPLPQWLSGGVRVQQAPPARIDGGESRAPPERAAIGRSVLPFAERQESPWSAPVPDNRQDTSLPFGAPPTMAATSSGDAPGETTLASTPSPFRMPFASNLPHADKTPGAETSPAALHAEQIARAAAPASSTLDDASAHTAILSMAGPATPSFANPLPFVTNPVAPMQIPAAVRLDVSPPPQPLPRPAPERELDATVVGVRISPFSNPLPFAQGSALSASTPAQSPPVPEAQIPPSALGAPEQDGAQDGAPALSLAQYASLCAELAVAPHARDATFRRYGLGTPRQQTIVDRAWQTRLLRNPVEYREWQALYEHYSRYWLARRLPMDEPGQGGGS
ncbi:hypothetical protein [Sorangium sp. So ce362]|uniref:hypothetical protein n=1 Tax=Sorangium sp. So ce362 TaxID=3133303 RepID=UPI003F5EBEDF